MNQELSRRSLLAGLSSSLLVAGLDQLTLPKMFAQDSGIEQSKPTSLAKLIRVEDVDARLNFPSDVPSVAQRKAISELSQAGFVVALGGVALSPKVSTLSASGAEVHVNYVDMRRAVSKDSAERGKTSSWVSQIAGLSSKVRRILNEKQTSLAFSMTTIDAESGNVISVCPDLSLSQGSAAQALAYRLGWLNAQGYKLAVPKSKPKTVTLVGLNDKGRLVGVIAPVPIEEKDSGWGKLLRTRIDNYISGMSDPPVYTDNLLLLPTYLSSEDSARLEKDGIRLTKAGIIVPGYEEPFNFSSNEGVVGVFYNRRGVVRLSRIENGLPKESLRVQVGLALHLNRRVLPSWFSKKEVE